MKFKSFVVAFLIFTSAAFAQVPGTFSPLLPVGKSPFSFTFITSAVDASATTSHSYSGVSFGLDNPDREIVITIGLSGSNSVSSIVIGGVAATIDADITSAVIARAKPSGTSGTITYTSSASIISAIGVYRMVSGIVVGSNTATVSNGDVSTLVATVAGGSVVSSVRANQAPVSATTFTAGGLTKDVQQQLNNANNQFVSGSLFPSTASAGLTVTASQTGSGGSNNMSTVSYGPQP